MNTNPELMIGVIPVFMGLFMMWWSDKKKGRFYFSVYAFGLATFLMNFGVLLVLLASGHPDAFMFYIWFVLITLFGVTSTFVVILGIVFYRVMKVSHATHSHTPNS